MLYKRPWWICKDMFIYIYYIVVLPQYYYSYQKRNCNKNPQIRLIKNSGKQKIIYSLSLGFIFVLVLGQVSEWWYHHGSFNLFFRVTLINSKHMYPLVTGLVISWHNYYQNTTKHSRKSALTWCRRHGVHHTIVFPGFLTPSCDEFCCDVYCFFYTK